MSAIPTSEVRRRAHASTGQRAPLSLAQERLWALQQLSPDSVAYNATYLLTIDGPLHVRALVRALREVVSRHEILRSGIDAEDGVPTLFAAERAGAVLTLVDLASLPAVNAERESAEIPGTLAAVPIVLSRPPLARSYLFRIAPDRHVLLFLAHHIVCDAESAEIFFDEVSMAYESALNGAPPRLAALPLQYAGHSRREREGAQARDERIDERVRALADRGPSLLPADGSPGGDEEHGALVPFHIDAGRTAAVRQLARTLGTTLNAVLLAALAALIARMSGGRDVVIGLTVSNRQTPDVARLIGLFVNIVPVQIDCAGRPAFRDLVRRTTRALVDALSVNIPFERLHRALDVARAARAPVFQVVWTFRPRGRRQLALAGCSVQRGRAVETQASAFELELLIGEQRADLDGYLLFRSGTFTRATIDAFAARFATLIDEAISAPDRAISELPVIGAAERALLTTFASGPVALEAPAWDLRAAIAAHAAGAPEDVAVVTSSSSMTFEALETSVRRLARRLSELGVGPETRVALFLDRSADLVVAMLAVLRTGGCYVPLDPAYPTAQTSRLLARVAPAVVVTSRARESALPAVTAYALLIDEPEPDDRLETAPPECPFAAIDRDHAAYILFTSGSTGEAKGVCVTYGGLSNYMAWAMKFYAAGAGQGSPVHTSASFDLTITSIFPLLAAGRSIVLLDPGAPIEALADLLRSGPDYGLVKLTPAHMRALALLLRPEEIARSTRALVIGGEPLDAADVAPWKTAAPGVPLFNEYGPTETVVGCTVYDARATESGPVPIGRPVANTRIHVVDDTGALVPVGVPGELCVSGAGVARGYVDRPDLTAERFLPDPFSGVPGDRLYRTGDRVRWLPSGDLAYIGRTDEQVKVRGFRVEPGEISCALRRHPDIQDCAAVMVARSGGLRSLTAFVVRAPNAAITAAQVMAHARAELPAFMIPAEVIFVPALPLTENGKVDRAMLSSWSVDQPAVAPRAAATPAEQALLEIWQDVLGHDRIGMDDNFFALGGDSILSIQIMARATARGFDLRPDMLFEHPTIAELARAIAPLATPADRPAPPPAKDGGLVRLTPIQASFFEAEPIDPDIFAQVLHLEPRDTPDHIWPAALGALMQRHQALRLRVGKTSDGWRQWIDESVAAVPFTHVDVSALPERDQKAAIDALMEQACGALDTRSGPVCRMMLVARGHTRPRQLVWIVHHAAVDAVSWRILMDELTAWRAGARLGDPIVLPDAPASCVDWARAFWRAVPGVERERAFWLDQPWQDVRGLRVDGVAASHGVKSATVATRLGEQVSSALLRHTPRGARTHVVETLFAALAVALRGMGEGRAVQIDLEEHGRAPLPDTLDVSRIVGWLATLTPVIVPLDPAGSPERILDHIQRFVHARPRGGLGYALLRAGASPDDAIASLPASSIRFNYLGSMRPAASVAAAFQLLGATTRRSPRASSSYAIEIDANASADGTSIDITWTYDARAFRAETIARLASRFEDALATLVRQGTGDVHDAARRPASMPFAQVNEHEMARLFREHPTLEDLYPLTPVQQGILFHCLYEPNTGVYIDQFSCDLLGALDAAAFTAAWRTVIQRQPMLRTSIIWEGLDRPHQAVHARVEPDITYEDRRELPFGNGGVAAYLEADRARGFQLLRAPLLRVALFRAEPDRHTLVCSWHHLILDGWSLRILLQEVATIYRALTTGASHVVDTLETAPAPRFSEYVEWLSHRDDAAARDFWRAYLQDASQTSIRRPSAVDRTQASDANDDASWPLGGELSARLASFARARCLTISTVIEAAWALVVGQRTGVPDVVVGLTVSSRPAGLPHADTAVGLYINTVPLRIRLTSSVIVAGWLDDLQKTVASLQLYAHSPLPVIQAAAGLSGPAFDHVLVIENYPVHESAGAMGLQLDHIHSVERTSYALTVVVVPGRDITLHAISQRRHIHPDDARALLRELARAVDAIVCGAESTVEDIRARLMRQRGAPAGALADSVLTPSEADAASRALAAWRSSGRGTTTS